MGCVYVMAYDEDEHDASVVLLYVLVAAVGILSIMFLFILP